MSTATAIVPGSLRAISQQTGRSLAETFLSAEVVVLVDVSGSMNTDDARGQRRRYDVACEELRKLQAAMPGQVAVIGFSLATLFHPDGVPMYQGAGTLLLDALRFVKVADGTGVRFVVISDGWPESPDRCLALARQFEDRIDCVYCGPEGDPGEQFLRQLANAGKGGYDAAFKANELAGTVSRMLTPGAR